MEAEMRKINRKFDKFLDLHNTCYLKGLALEKLSDQYDYTECLTIALECYTKAIAKSHDESSPEEGFYLLQRSMLNNKMGKSRAAAKDMVTACSLSVEVDEIHRMYMDDVKGELAKLNSIQNEIGILKENGAIDSMLANVLSRLGEAAADNTAHLAIHDRELKEHNIKIGTIEIRQEISDAKYEELRKNLELAVQFMMKGANKNLTNEELPRIIELVNKLELKEEMTAKKVTQLQNVQLEKVDRNELETYVFKIPETISNNPQLYNYYNALFDKLNSSITEAIVVTGGGNLSLSASKIVVTAFSAAALQIPYGGSIVGKSIRTASELKTKNDIKMKAVSLKGIASNPDERYTIVKNIAIAVTLNKAEVIKQVTPENEEVKNWTNRDVINTCKDFIGYNIDRETYHNNSAEIFGCIDAMKIIKYITKGMMKGSDKEDEPLNQEILDQLIEVPSMYVLTLSKKCLIFLKENYLGDPTKVESTNNEYTSETSAHSSNALHQ